MLEHDVGRRAQQLADVLGEAPGLLLARALLLGRLVAAPHHAGELAAVHGRHGAERAAQLALGLGGDHADAVGAGEAAELGREHAEPARRAPDEHAVAALELDLVDQHAVGGEERQPVGGGLLPGQVRGLAQELLGLDLAELGERAPRRLVAPDLLGGGGERVQAVDLDVLVGGLVAVDDDLVAGLPARDALADLPDDAGGVRAADVVVLLAVAEDGDRLAERRPDVVEVDPGRHDADDHLEGAGLGYRHLLELEGLQRLPEALLADDPGGHGRGQLPRLHVNFGDSTGVDGHEFTAPRRERRSRSILAPAPAAPRHLPPVGRYRCASDPDGRRSPGRLLARGHTRGRDRGAVDREPAPERPRARGRRRLGRRDHAGRLPAHLGARGRGARQRRVRASFTDGREVAVQVVGADPLSDLAVLRADGAVPAAVDARRRRRAARRPARGRDRQPARLRELGHRRGGLGARAARSRPGPAGRCAWWTT